MGVPGPKLIDDERFTQDLILVSPASFVTPNIRENAKLQRWVRAKAPLAYAINPFDSHLLHMFMQLLYSPMQANPLEVQYYSNVPFLLGEDQAVEYSLKPRERARTRIPARPAENYLRDAMVRTLTAAPRTFDFMIQVQTDPHLMPIEDATVKWPESLSPYITVARLHLPASPLPLTSSWPSPMLCATTHGTACPTTNHWGTRTEPGKLCTGSLPGCARP